MFMFALAARHLSLLSETFVLAHAQRLAPGRSAFITFDDRPVPELKGPFLCDVGGRPCAYDIAGAPEGAAPLLPWGRLPGLRARHVARFLRRTSTEVMMAEFGGMGCEMMVPAEAAGTRLHVHFHGYDASSHLRFPKIVARYRQLFQRAEGFVTPSRFIADNLIGLGCPAARITVVPCGVDPANFAPAARQPGRCIAVGRFVEKKNPLATIHAFAKAAARHPEAELDYIGDGPLWEKAKAAVTQMGLGDRLRLLGPQPHDVVRAKMAEAAIFLQHSVTAANHDTEGLPVAILEAMCAGLTVISTRHSGIPEAVIEGHSGLLVNEHDVAGMAVAIDAALQDPEMARDLGQAARVRVLDNFTLDHAIRTLQDSMGLELTTTPK